VAEETWRTFIAVELPAEVKEALRAPLKTLEEMNRLVRASSPDGIHLTLHFLGELDAVRVDQLRGLLQPPISKETAFTVDVKGVGAFPTMARPRTIWAGIEGDEKERLHSLQVSIGRTLKAAGFQLEERDYSPHLTLGRLRRPASGSDRQALLKWRDEWRSTSLGRIPVDGVSLMRSQLSSGPPRYTALQTFGLAR
jgi:2'-5' RNA ligase